VGVVAVGVAEDVSSGGCTCRITDGERDDSWSVETTARNRSPSIIRVAVDARTVLLDPPRSVHGPFRAVAVCHRTVIGEAPGPDHVNVAVKVAICPSRTVCAAGRTARAQPASSPAAEGGVAVVGVLEASSGSLGGGVADVWVSVSTVVVEVGVAEDVVAGDDRVVRVVEASPWDDAERDEAEGDDAEGDDGVGDDGVGDDGVAAPAVAGSPIEATSPTTTAAARSAHTVPIRVRRFVIAFPPFVASAGPLRQPTCWAASWRLRRRRTTITTAITRRASSARPPIRKTM
jgi:hypothetical protein